MASVVLEGVSRVFPGGAIAVHDLDLEVRDKELLVLVGPSGCGKTTTLRMIAGLEEISTGTIKIGERVVNGVAPKDRDIAMVFQNYALYPHMTVYKNLSFGLELRFGANWLKRAWWRVFEPARASAMAVERRRIGERVRDAATTLGIERLLERMPRQLSGGERQRVALGRAIVRQPAAFLFDEPLSSLDARLRVDMRRELKQLHQRLGTTMIYVTHDQIEAMTLGERIAVMDRGIVQQVGSPREVYDRPRNRFVAGFIGSPAMNLVEGSLTASGTGPAFDGGWFTAAIASTVAPAVERFVGRAIVFGVRPEDVELAPESNAGGTRIGSFSAAVALVEPLGDASIVHLAPPEAASDTNGSADRPRLVAKTGSRAEWKRGDRVSASWDALRAHWFDSLSGMNLAPDQSEAA